MSKAALAPFFPAVTPLGEYMDALVSGSQCQQDSDLPEFKRFLRTALVGHGPFNIRLELSEPVERLADTIQMVIGMLLKRVSSSMDKAAWRGRNILALGYEARSNKTMNCAGGGWGIENTCVNSSVVELGKRRWSLLLNRTGTEAMVHLLLHTSVFLPLYNGSYNQISGTPLVNLPMPHPTAISVPAIKGLFEPSTMRASKRPRSANKLAADEIKSEDRRRTAKRQRRSSDADPSHQHTPQAKRPRHGGFDMQPELSNVVVDTSAMLYSHPRVLRHKVKWSLPQTFPLNPRSTPSELIKRIFSRTPVFAANPPSRLLSLVTRMVKLHEKFNYRFHLFKRCAAPWQNPSTPDAHEASEASSQQQAPDSAASASATSPLAMASTQHDVYLFLQACVRNVIPRDLIGDKHNHRLIYKLLRALAGSSRFGSMDLTGAMQRAKTDEVASWLCGKYGSTAVDVYAGFLCWVLGDYAVHLIRAFFYVTESSSDRNRLFFFRGDVWTRITQKALKSLESDLYTKKTLAEVTIQGSAWPTFGYSRLRLLPKENGFRAVSNLKQSFAVKKKALWRDGSQKPRYEYMQVPMTPTNKLLADSLAALNYLRRAQPQLVGSTVTNVNDIYTKLKAFKDSEHIRPLLGKATLYMGKLDIQKAYDTIVQAKLLELLETQLPNEEYMVYKYWTLLPLFGRYRSSYLRQGGTSNDPVPFGDMARTQSKKSRLAVFGNQLATAYLDTDAIRQLVREHITTNMVRMRSGFWQQKKGIPQGSVLSTMLCNFFYGQLEREHLAALVDPTRTLMMRMVDDFIVISSDQSQVMAVLEYMHRGVAEYGCELNKAKTVANFEVTICSERISQTAGKFPWCGLLFDERTLDVFADYSRLAHAGVLGVVLGAKSTQTGDIVLGHRMATAVRLRMHKLYMDCSFNSRHTVLVNLYQNFLVCGKKMHATCLQLSASSKGDDVLFKVVLDLISLGYILLRTRCGDNAIPPSDVTWLGLTAFHAVLRRKQARYTQLLARLHSTLSLPKFAQMARRHGAVVDSPDNAVALSIAY
ncbi:Telomerase reverse transcriptase [Coemansia sp. BCRC 34301]|nr:Telomerase reverse transcriptase [Coemansia sp. BCRC 34301]